MKIRFDVTMFRWETVKPLPANYADLIPMSRVVMTQEQYLNLEWSCLEGQRYVRTRCAGGYKKLTAGKEVVTPQGR